MPKKASAPKNPITPEAVARIYSATSKQNNGIIPKNSFAAHAASIVAKMQNSEK